MLAEENAALSFFPYILFLIINIIDGIKKILSNIHGEYRWAYHI